MTFNFTGIKDTVAQIQREQKNWEIISLGEQPIETAVLGCVEEIGELSRAILKSRQGIRGTKEEWFIKAKDAVGDTIVYLLGFCNKAGIDLSATMTAEIQASGDAFRFNILDSYGCIMSASKEVNSIACRLEDLDRKPPAVDGTLAHHCLMVFIFCDLFCQRFFDEPVSAIECLEMAWSEVRERDWQKNRLDGKV